MFGVTWDYESTFSTVKFIRCAASGFWQTENKKKGNAKCPTNKFIWITLGVNFIYDFYIENN